MLEGVFDSLKPLLRSLCAIICERIYPVIGYTYDLFIKVAEYRLIDSSAENNPIREIYYRITLILSIVMVFYITFELVKYLVQPDTISDKQKGIQHVPLKLISIILLIAFIPNIFELSGKLESAVITNELIPKIVLGRQSITVGDGYDTYGRNFAWNLLNLFYYVEDAENTTDMCDGIPCYMLPKMNANDLLNYGRLSYVSYGINATTTITVGADGYEEEVTANLIHFEGLWAILVGLLVGYMLILYCIDMGARAVQLIYLQVIAPIPIIGILSSTNEGIFKKWVKQCTTTYLDIFIRLLIICYVILISNAILVKGNILSNVKIAIIIGLLVFAKRAPKLIQELFPSMGAASGTLGLKFGDRPIGRVAGATVGAAAGAVTGAATGIAQGLRKAESVEGAGKKARAGLTGAGWGAIRGIVGGTGRGLVNGANKSSNESIGSFVKNVTKGASEINKSNKTYGSKAAAGYTMGKQVKDSVGGFFGHSRKENLEAKKGEIDAEMKQREEENKRRADDLSRFDQKIIKENKMYGVEGGEARARLEAEKRNRLNLKQQLEDIEDPNSELRKNYVVGSEKQDEASQSRIAAIRASADAKKSRYGAMADLYADDAITDLNEMFGRTILTPITPNRDTVIKTFLANRYGINEADFYRSGTTTVDESKYNDALHKAFLQEIEDKEYNQRIAAENLRFNTQEEADEARTKKKLELGNLMAKSDDTFSAAAYDAAREIDATTGKAYDEVIADRDRVQKTSITLHNQQVSADYRINIKDEYKKVEAEIIRQRTYDAIKATHPERYHSLSEVTAEDIADYTRNVQREIARSRVFREAAPGIYADISAVTDQAITDYINHNDPIQIVANGDIEVQWRKAYAKNRQNDLTDESSKTTAELEKVKKEMASSKNGNS